MKNTTYRFTTKSGKVYSGNGANPSEARDNIEFLFGVNLSGAKLEILYKLRVVESWTVR